jgi:hypothetical protein
MAAGDRLTIKRAFRATYGSHRREVELPAGTYNVLPGPRPGVHTLSGGPPGGKRYRAQVTSGQLEELRKAR